MKDEKLPNKIRVNKHPRRKNNDLVAGMYALYCAKKENGKPNSMADVARWYKRSRQAVYELFKTRGYPLRSKPLRGLQVLDGIRFTLTKNGYLRGSVNGERMLMHHYVWQKYTGSRVLPGWNIHHKDGNKENNDISNLEILTASEHTRRYSPHLNQFTAPNGSRVVRRHKLSGAVRLLGSRHFVHLSKQ